MDRHPAGGPAAIAIAWIAGGGVKRPMAIAWIAGGVSPIAWIALIAGGVSPIAIARIAGGVRPIAIAWIAGRVRPILRCRMAVASIAGGPVM